MKNSNEGDMSSLVNKESIFTKNEKNEDDVLIKDILGREINVPKPSMVFFEKEDVEKAFLSKEEEEWIKQFSGISIPDGKEYNGFRHHHYKLANKISAMCERIKELEETVKILRAIQPDWVFNYFKKCVKEISKQEEKAKYEMKKLKKLKEKYLILGGIK